MTHAAQPPGRTILALDTALGACSAAIIRDENMLASAFELRSRGHAEALMPMIEAVCRDAGTAFREIDLIAVTLGPGTFTGVRIGLAAARGLALALDRPLFGCSTLEAIAWGAVASEQGGSLPPSLVVAHDARRGELYAQCFDITGGRPRAATPPMLVALDEVTDFLPKGPVALAGSAARLILSGLPASSEAVVLTGAPSEPDARSVARLANEAEQRRAPGAAPPHYLDQPRLAPVYLRAPDAKLPTPGQP